MFLNGKWNATCPMEVSDKTTLTKCELCTFQIDPSKPSIEIMQDFEMDFENNKIIMKYGDKTSTVPCSRDKVTFHKFCL